MSFSGCGFIGSYTFDGSHPNLSKQIFSKMVLALAHRGPDAEGLWQDAHIALGHRRLSILDLSENGKQPMTRGNITIAYNGEVYNYESVREELRSLGYGFSSDTDTEVILAAYQEWGITALERLDGMFAFAIWDVQKKELLLVRDHLGIKPLYYYQNEDYLIFGSEIQALMHSGFIPAKLNTDSLFREIHLGSMFNYQQDETLVAGVRSLLPGEWMLVKANGEITKEKYYQIAIEKQGVDLSEDQLTEQLNQLLHHNIKSHLISDVPVAAFLSGGIDSSLINAIACLEQTESKLTAITISYQGGSKDPYTQQDNNDLIFSQQLASHFPDKIEHRILEIAPANLSLANLDAIIDLASITDDDRQLTIYANYQAVKQEGIKVVLNGQGADEMMGGYIAYIDFFADESTPIANRLQKLIDFRCTMRKEVMGQAALEKQEEVFKGFCDLYHSYPGDHIERYHRLMMDTQLQRILKFEDYLSMQHSIECRVPFITQSLVNWSFQTSFNQHIRWSEPVMGKMLLRKVAESILPEALVNRPKQVFPSADKSLFQQTLHQIVQENKEAIRACEAIQAVYNVNKILDNPEILEYKELWLLVALWRWEVKLKSFSNG